MAFYVFYEFVFNFKLRGKESSAGKVITLAKCIWVTEMAMDCNLFDRKVSLSAVV